MTVLWRGKKNRKISLSKLNFMYSYIHTPHTQTHTQIHTCIHIHTLSLYISEMHKVTRICCLFLWQYSLSVSVAYSLIVEVLCFLSKQKWSPTWNSLRQCHTSKGALSASQPLVNDDDVFLTLNVLLTSLIFLLPQEYQHVLYHKLLFFSC